MTPEEARDEVRRRYGRWWRRNYFAKIRDDEYCVGYDLRFWFTGRLWWSPWGFNDAIAFMGTHIKTREDYHG